MSHQKVKSIKIDSENKKVFINCATSNLIPLTYYREEYPYFSNILNVEGKEAVEIALLRAYEEGNLQDGTNKYTKALKVLFHVFGEQYNKFNWQNHNSKWGTEEKKKEEELRDSKEFKELLRNALNYKLPKVSVVCVLEGSNNGK